MVHTAFVPVERGYTMDAQLYDILSTPTPSGKEGNILKYMPKGYVKDSMGNLIYYVGKPSEHKTMFSSHMDTVHRTENPIMLVEAVEKNEPNGMIYAKDRTTGAPSVLGADDRIGMYTMLKLMEAKVPGMYVFHVQEEVGRKGSIALFNAKPELFKNIERCIAFDRRGLTSVITYQSGTRCCSDDFANAVATALNAHMKLPKAQYAPDTNGSYTDSATYMGTIPECTNISVGYYNEHTTDESFDLWWLENKFIPAILSVKWDQLPVKRDPKKVDSKYSYKSTYPSGVHSSTYRTNTANTDWSKFTGTTNWDQLPYWNMKDGIPKGASDQAVKNAIVKKFASSVTLMQMEVLDLLKENAKLKFENDGLLKTVDVLEQENKEAWGALSSYYECYSPKKLD